MKRVKIKVTADDIRYGICNTRGCPVALAIKKMLSHGNLWSVRVIGDGTIYLMSTGSPIRIEAPRSVKKFVKNYDRHKKVKPFNFFMTLSNKNFKRAFKQ